MNSQTTSAARSSAAPLQPELTKRKLLVLAWLDRLAPVLAALAVIGVWELICRVFALPNYLLPSPSAIVTSAFALDPGIWLTHTWATLRVSLGGYALAIIIAIPLAVLLANSRLMSRTLYPMLVVIQSTPIVGVAPIIVVLMGAGEMPRIFITFLITFFPIVVSTVTGLMSTPEELKELSRSLGASKAREIRNIQLPFAVPYIFSALRISITLAIIGAVVAEFVAAEKGLGFFIAFSTSFLRIPQAFAALIVLVTLSLLLFQVIALVQRWLFPWSLPKESR
ncbi:ABC transporter permease [Alkalilimnicola ehrlichii]|uniref:ABC transporter permease n=1 Tax=Alkalilimnicola ehrlichii TaxID=351052 RepID=A0A3E0WZI8_9GAMM|nr:ABC transporter permease [Alkalilimnicola ehrlichii]RFA28423.1 ABC transporter permease [Alkalilimnicola ehrlichii]RFA38509.1 ABC transporter permease [Alkalilimnicola ehrlichii]